MAHLFSIIFPLAILSLSCSGLGGLTLSLFSKRSKESDSVEYVMAFVLGQGVLGSILIFPVLIGQFTKPVILTLMVPLALVGAWSLFSLTQRAPAGLRKSVRIFRNAEFIWQLLLVATALLVLVSASAFMGRIDGDARAFYLALPKVIAASHRLSPLPAYENFISVGLLAELQLAVLFLFDMPGASPRLYSWVTSFAGVVLLAAIARSAGLGKRGQLLSVVMFLTSSAVAYFWGAGKTDLFAAVFALAGILVSIRSWRENSNRGLSVMLVGLFTGFSLVAKLSYIVGFLPSIFVLVFWKDVQLYWPVRKEVGAAKTLLHSGLKYAPILIIGLLIPLVPHLLKNYILLNTLFDTYGSQIYFSEATTRRIVLTYPVLLIFGSFWAQYGNLSPLLLAFAPVMVFMFWKQRPWRIPVVAILCAGVAGVTIWILMFPSVPMPRYFLATLLLFIFPIAWAMEKATYADRWLNYLIVAVALGSIFAFYKSWKSEFFHVAAAYQYILGNQSENSLQIDEKYSRDVYESINRIAEKGDRVFLATYYRFWLRPDLIQCTNGIKDGLISFDSSNPENFWLQLYESGFSFIFMDRAHPAFGALKSIPSWLEIETVYNEIGYGSAYRLKFSNPPGRVRASSIEISPGYFTVVYDK